MSFRCLSHFISSSAELNPTCSNCILCSTLSQFLLWTPSSDSLGQFVPVGFSYNSNCDSLREDRSEWLACNDGSISIRLRMISHRLLTWIMYSLCTQSFLLALVERHIFASKFTTSLFLAAFSTPFLMCTQLRVLTRLSSHEKAQIMSGFLMLLNLFPETR